MEASIYAGVTAGESDAGRVVRSRLLDALLIVQIVVGFEFFWTVLAKLVRGGFVSGLAADLQDRVQAAPGWYRSFAEHVVIPHARTFGYMIITGELFVGVTLIVVAVVWLARWQGLSIRGRGVLVGLTMAAALAGMTMNVNYHVASGALNPWQLADSVFDEGVDLNSVLTMIEATIVVVMITIAVSLRREARSERQGV